MHSKKSCTCVGSLTGIDIHAYPPCKPPRRSEINHNPICKQGSCKFRLEVLLPQVRCHLIYNPVLTHWVCVFAHRRATPRECPPSSPSPLSSCPHSGIETIHPGQSSNGTRDLSSSASTPTSFTNLLHRVLHVRYRFLGPRVGRRSMTRRGVVESS